MPWNYSLAVFTTWLLRGATDDELAEIYQGVCGMRYGFTVSYINGEPMVVEFKNVYPAESICLLNRPALRHLIERVCSDGKHNSETYEEPVYEKAPDNLTHEQFHEWHRDAIDRSIKRMDARHAMEAAEREELERMWKR